MTNKELITELSERLGWTQIKVSEVLAETIEQMNTKLAENASITIPNFGVFQTRKKSERISVNPQTQQRFLVPPKISVNFKPSTILKEKYK
ncbi:MAG: HU family DNA-binding protein [Dysgonamonadaceae bacterium]|nr:HU family DNA-binding protein [Dysgonamonadaceae bacterium]MDD3728451.1 HU family DNA-binding protein [Dysgonamonadaceae bacterium]MDD4246362.1 HU family DNA-binding protein [Dysgonamonadaceae bacterium]MDD4606339.1 HU family DNA-binding protein [Dysgonamonadaceae bacterium]